MTERSAALTDLRAALPETAVVTDRELLAGYRHDQAGLATAGWPLALLRPSSTREVGTILALADRHRLPVVARGAGSGLSGGANAIAGCLMLSTERMDRIIEISEEDMLAVVQPGVLNGDLTSRANELGLDYPPDPASAAFSTIGGNIATNAGGLCCVKYGVTRDFVLGLEVVLADGRVMRVGRRTVKGVAGLDLTALFVGSEGTLGVVTEATLRLRPARPAPCTLVALFPTVEAAGTAASEAMRHGLVPSMLELLDRATIRAVDDWTQMGLDRGAGGLLVAQSDSGGAQGEEEMDALRRHCEAAGATYVARSTDPDEAESLLQARRLAYPALERLGATLLDDVAVPRSRVPALLRAIEEIADGTPVMVATFGHVGDGNMHPTLVYDPEDPAQAAAARRVFAEIVAAARAFGGTITGEHGVGSLKRDFLGAELGTEAMAVHHAIKRTFDPNGILNPGKVLAMDGQPEATVGATNP